MYTQEGKKVSIHKNQCTLEKDNQTVNTNLCLADGYIAKFTDATAAEEPEICNVVF
jgi:hypothetical protein